MSCYWFFVHYCFYDCFIESIIVDTGVWISEFERKLTLQQYSPGSTSNCFDAI